MEGTFPTLCGKDKARQGWKESEWKLAPREVCSLQGGADRGRPGGCQTRGHLPSRQRGREGRFLV